MLLDAALQLGNAFKRAVPAKFQFRCHQTIGGVGCIVLSERLVRSVAGGLKVTPERLKYLIAAVGFFPIRLQCRFDRSWFEHAKELVFDSIVDTQPAERNAARLRSTYRRGDSVQTIGTTSDLARLFFLLALFVLALNQNPCSRPSTRYEVLAAKRQPADKFFQWTDESEKPWKEKKISRGSDVKTCASQTSNRLCFS
jgi:hypothetical protein